MKNANYVRKSSRKLIRKLGGFALVTAIILTAGVAGAYDSEAETLSSMPANQYLMSGTVIEVNKPRYEVSVADRYGNEWVFFGGGFSVGDDVIMTFDDNGTHRIDDDIIVGVRPE